MVSSVLSSVLFTGLVAAQWPQNPQWGGPSQQPRGNQWPGPQQGPGWGGQYQGAPGFNGQYQGAPGFNGQYQGAPGFGGQYPRGPGFGGQQPRGQQPSASSKDDEGQLGDLPTVLPDPRNDSNYTRYCQILPYDAKPNYGIQCQWGNGTVATISQKGVNTLLNMHAVTPEPRYNACNAYLPFFCKRTMRDFEDPSGETTLTWLAVNVGMKTCWITEGNIIDEERTKCVQQLTECKKEWMANEYTDAREPDTNNFDHTARKYPGWPGPNVPADQDNGYFGVNWKIPQRDLAARTTPAGRCIYNNMGSEGRRQR